MILQPWQARHTLANRLRPPAADVALYGAVARIT